MSEDYRRIAGLRAEVAARDHVTDGATKGAELLYSSVPVVIPVYIVLGSNLIT